MTSPSVVAVAAQWRLHADAVVAVLEDHGVRAHVVDTPVDAPGLLLMSAMLPEHEEVLEARRAVGRETIVWGGTLPVPRIASLRASGAAAYVTMLQAPRELADVVQRVLAGEPVAWVETPDIEGVLTSRERAVAEAYLVTGADHTRAEVAADLGISERTLKVHVANIRAKIGHRGTETREGLRRSLTVRGWLA